MDKQKVDQLIFGFGVDSYNRLPLFIKNSKGLTDDEYWYGLGNAYTCSDNLFEWKELVNAAFSVDRSSREHLMSKREQKKIDSLPEIITIYRCMTDEELKSGKFGLSWTLKKSVATFFADKYLRNFSTANLKRVIHSLQVPKSKVIAYFNSRKEQEIIYINNPLRSPEKIISNHVKKWKPVRYDPYGIDHLLANYRFTK